MRLQLGSWNWWRRAPSMGQAALLLLATWLILCRPWLVQGLFIPWDSKDQFYPFLYFVAQSLRAGDSPFWNPYIYGGYPMASDPQSMIFSPLALALMLVADHPTPFWFDFIELLHLLVGGLGMLLVCVYSGWSSVAGLYAALVYMFGGSAAARMQHVPMIFAYSYFPFALWTLKLALDRHLLRWGVAFGVVAGIMAAHQNQVAYLLSLTLIGYVSYQALSSGAVRSFISSRWKVLSVGALTGLMVLAVPFYLTLQFLPLSNRFEIPYSDAVAGSLHPLPFLTLFVRDFFGNSLPSNYWGFNDVTESYLYIGMLPIMLIAAYGVPRRMFSEPQFRYFLIVGVFGVLYALGKFTPFYWLAYHGLPGVALYKRPPDATFLITTVLALATGFLVHRLLQGSPPPWKRSWILGEIIVLAALFSWGIRYAWQQQRVQEVIKDASLALLFVAIAVGLLYAMLASQSERVRLYWAWVGLLLVAIDLGVYNAGTRLNAHDLETSALLTNSRPSDRALTRFLVNGLDREHRAGGPYRAEITYAGSLWANAPIMFGIRSTQGYNPLRYFLYERVAGAQESGNLARSFTPWLPGYNTPLLNLLGVKYIVSAEDLPTIDPAVNQAQFSLVFKQDVFRVWENPRVLPRLLTATAVRLQPDLDSAPPPGTMASVDFRSTVVLGRLPDTLSGVPTASDSSVVLPGQGDVQAQLLRDRNTEIVVAVQSDRDIILVLNDLFYPYWRVYVDSQERELLRANYLFRGVHVKPGAHRVEFRFEPFSWPAVRGTFARLLQRAR